MTNAAPSVQDIRARLRGLRRRLRVVVTLIGGARLIVAVLGTLALYFAADYLLNLPMGVRRFIRLGLFDRPDGLALILWILLLGVSVLLALALTRSRRGWSWLFAFVAGGIIGLSIWFGVRFFQGLRVRFSDEDLALTVEQKYRALNDRLAASLDFARELRKPTRGESEAMMRSVVDEAVAEVRGLPVSRAVSGRRAAEWLGAAALACVVAVGVAAAMPATIGLWFDRGLKLEDKAWPQDTTLLAVLVEEDGTVTPWNPNRPYEVAHGRPLVVYAEAQGDVPDEVVLVDLVPGQAPEERRMYRVPEVPGVFAYEFRDVRSPFSFMLQGGDDVDETPIYTVEITIPPRVIDINTLVTYPEYLGGQSQTLEGGSPTVPQGSTVEVRFGTDVPVRRARVLRGDESEDVTAIEVNGVRQYRFAFRADDTTVYRLHLETPEGRTNDSALDSYTVKVRRDRAPKTEWIYPRGTMEVTPEGRLPILARISDDYGVSRIVLEVRTGPETTTRYTLRPFAEGPDAGADAGDVLFANDGPYERKQILCYAALDVPDLKGPSDAKVKAPAQLSMRLLAFDSLGQTREGDWTYADVFAGSDLERGLAGRRNSVRSAIETLRGEQRSRHQELVDLTTGTRAADDLDTIKAVRFAQGKIAQDADQAVRGLIEVFNAFLYDRLGAPNPTEKILRMFDSHHRATYGLPPAARGDGETVPGGDSWIGDPVFPYALYERIVKAWQDKLIYDRGLIDRMLAVMQDAVAVAARLAPETYNAVARALSGKDEDLKAAVASQKQLLDALDSLLQKMDSWQSLSDVTLRVRRLIEEQRAMEYELSKENK
ncbi:MAG: DUF4175 family protein [Planctomycetota bacterium]|nr:DUF4175 family protein [Planctomycetota bacterium]